jgi:hypothetical protein
MLTRKHELQALKERRVTSFILAVGWSSLAFWDKAALLVARWLAGQRGGGQEFRRRLDLCRAAPAPRRSFTGALKGKKARRGARRSCRLSAAAVSRRGKPATQTWRRAD